MHTVTCRHKPGLVGILSGDLGRWAEWTGSMFKMIFPTGSNYKWVRGNGFALNRNIIVRTLLENQHWEWLWFMDDDHVFDGDLVLRLLERDVDIIQPLVSTRKAPFQPYAYEWDATENSYVSMDWPQLQPDGIQQVDAVGCGGMLVRRRVFEAMSDPWFEEGKTSAEHIGEDLYFCFPGETGVLTGTGLCPIKDVVQGQQVMTHNGRWRPVTECLSRAYSGSMVKFKVSGDNQAIRSTPGHKYFAIRGGAIVPEWHEAKLLEVGDWIGLPRCRSREIDQIRVSEWLDVVSAKRRSNAYRDKMWLETNYATKSTRQIARECGVDQKAVMNSLKRHGIPRRATAAAMAVAASACVTTPPQQGVKLKTKGIQTSVPEVLNVTPELARCLGLYLAEGHVHHSSVWWSFNAKTERHMKGVIAAGMSQIEGCAIVVSREDEACFQLCVSNATLAALVKEMFGTGSTRKRIPQCVFEWSRHLVAQFVRGYIEGDGHLNANRGMVQFTTVSESLAYGMKALLATCGITCGVGQYRNAETNVIEGRTVRRAPFHYIGTVSTREHARTIAGWLGKPGEASPVTERKLSTSRVNTDYVWTRITKKTEEVFSGQVYNLSVQDDESYCLQSAVVHNCTKARELGFGIYVDLDNKMGHMGTYHVWPQRHNGDWANKLVYNEVSMVVPWSFGRDLAAEEEANGSLQRSGA